MRTPKLLAQPDERSEFHLTAIMVHGLIYSISEREKKINLLALAIAAASSGGQKHPSPRKFNLYPRKPTKFTELRVAHPWRSVRCPPCELFGPVITLIHSRDHLVRCGLRPDAAARDHRVLWRGLRRPDVGRARRCPDRGHHARDIRQGGADYSGVPFLTYHYSANSRFGFWRPQSADTAPAGTLLLAARTPGRSRRRAPILAAEIRLPAGHGSRAFPAGTRGARAGVRAPARAPT